MSGELFSLRGRGALVTGAARGLGEAMALALADAGDLVRRYPLEDVATAFRDLEAGRRDVLKLVVAP